MHLTDQRVDGSPSNVLRHATAAAHRDLEAALDLMSPDITLTRYRQLLRGFASIHQTLDIEIGRQVEPFWTSSAIARLDVAARRKMPSIIVDLDRLGDPVPAAVPFRLTSLEAAMGAMYVCEGATLGGRIIAPHITRVLGGQVPVSYFTSYGADVPQRWSTCRQSINDTLDGSAARGLAVTAAIDVFNLFAEVLT